MRIVSVGVIRNSVKESKENGWGNVVSDIVINKEYETALDKIEGFSHVIVIFWIGPATRARRSVLKVHPRRRKDLPLVGVFAARSPSHPNPIGVTTVKILARYSNVLRVIGLDAVDRTLVIDIKPYIPGYDSPGRAKTPPWLKKLRQTSLQTP